jgi:uncharacterized protein (DUF1684 family)
MTSGREPFAYDQAEHEHAVEAWRRGRLARLTAPDSWLSLIGRFPLEDGTSTVGSAEDASVALPSDRAPAAVGRFERDGATVRFTPAAGVVMTLRSRDGVRELAPGAAVEVRTDRDGPLEKLVLGNVTLEVTEQPAGMFVRVRDPESPGRRDFAGIERYPVSKKWRVVARLERYEPARILELSYDGGSVERSECPGAAVFEVDGVTHRLEPVLVPDRSRLYLIFRDETARDTTYGAGRFLYAPLPEGDRVLLDFNQAFSPPCAFTPYSACPLTPFQNRLPVRVEAGELRP